MIVEYDKQEEAKGVLKRFPSTSKGAEYLSMDLLVTRGDLETGMVILKARNLIKQGIETPTIYEVLLEASVAAGFGETVAKLLVTASEKWPEMAAKFKKLGEMPAEDELRPRYKKGGTFAGSPSLRIDESVLV